MCDLFRVSNEPRMRFVMLYARLSDRMLSSYRWTPTWLAVNEIVVPSHASVVWSSPLPITTTEPSLNSTITLCERAGSRSREQLLALGGAVGNGELEIFRDELLDVWAADGVEIGDFDNLENLRRQLVIW
jgi:hypothetical protein